MITTVRENLIRNFNEITKDHCLYEVDLDKDELWDVYLLQKENPARLLCMQAFHQVYRECRVDR